MIITTTSTTSDKKTQPDTTNTNNGKDSKGDLKTCTAVSNAYVQKINLFLASIVETRSTIMLKVIDNIDTVMIIKVILM